MRRDSVVNKRGSRPADPWDQAMDLIGYRKAEIEKYNNPGANAKLAEILVEVGKIDKSANGVKALHEKNIELLKLRNETERASNQAKAEKVEQGAAAKVGTVQSTAVQGSAAAAVSVPPVAVDASKQSSPKSPRLPLWTRIQQLRKSPVKDAGNESKAANKDASSGYGNEFKATLVGMGKVLNKSSGPVGVFPASAGKSEIRIIAGEGKDKSKVVQTMELKSGAQLVATATEEVQVTRERFANEERQVSRERFANNVEVTLTNKNGITGTDIAEATAVLSKTIQDRGDVKDIKLEPSQNNTEQANKKVIEAVGPSAQKERPAAEIARVDVQFIGAPANNADKLVKAIMESVSPYEKGEFINKGNGYKITSKDGSYSVELNYTKDHKAIVEINAKPGHEEKAMESAFNMLNHIDLKTSKVEKDVEVIGSHKEAMEDKTDRLVFANPNPNKASPSPR